MAQFAIDQSYVIGQGIVYFTLFYTTMNYVAYRRARERAKERAKERDERKEKLGLKKTKDTL